MDWWVWVLIVVALIAIGLTVLRFATGRTVHSTDPSLLHETRKRNAQNRNRFGGAGSNL